LRPITVAQGIADLTFSQERTMHHITEARNSSNTATVNNTNLKLTLSEQTLTQRRRTPAADGWAYLAAKRCVDIVLASVLIVLTMPVMLFVGFLIWLDDHGPVLYYQSRVGCRGKVFRVYSFRVMYLAGSQTIDSLTTRVAAYRDRFQVIDGAGVHSVGAFMRKYSVDELPQLFSVLAGHQSIVGPRAQSPVEAGVYAPEQQLLQSVKPGIVCLREIRNRSNSSFEDRAASDLDYVMRRNAWMDLRIVARAWPAIIVRRRTI
jgi:lipopolysaccharide/colanic/teichoic acid biosynthesis glycosyltransferase